MLDIDGHGLKNS